MELLISVCYVLLIFIVYFEAREIPLGYKNLSGYINRFGETHLNWFLELPHCPWVEVLHSS